MAYPTPPPRDPTSPDPRGPSRSISASFSRPGSTIDDLMARFSSPNPNPAPPTMSSPFAPPAAMGNGSAMSPPPMGQPAGYPQSLFSPAMGLAGMISPGSRGGPLPPYGGSNASAPGTPGLPGNENRQSQLLDLLRNAGQTPASTSPAPLVSQQANTNSVYQQYGLGSGQPPPLQQQVSYSHHHPAMQQNNSFSGSPSTGLNRVVSPTYGLSAGAGNNQAQNLLAALINGSSTPVPAAPQQEIPFAIHQPVIVHQQAPSPMPEQPVLPAADPDNSHPTEQSHALARADTFGIPKQDSVSAQEDIKADSTPAPAQTSTTAAEETLKTAESQGSKDPTAVPASESNESSETSKKTFFSAFVSPFDAFETGPAAAPAAPVPASESVSSTGTAAKKKSKKEKAAKNAEKVSILAAAHETSAVGPAPIEASKKPEPSQKAKVVKENASTPSPSSAIAPPKKAAKPEDIPVIYRSSAFVDESRTTTPFEIPSTDYIFDVSQPHVESLVHEPKRFEERRISNIRTHVMTHGLGAASLLRAGTNALVYALPKGKARIVNQDTAASALVTLQSSETSSPINVVDLAVTDEWVVLLGEDGSFGIWAIDLLEEDSSIFSERVFFYSAEQGGLAPRRVELTRSGQADVLMVMTESLVFSVEVEKLNKSDRQSLVDKMNVRYESSHPDLVDIDVSTEQSRIAVIARSGHFFVYAIGLAKPIAQGVYHPTDGSWSTSIRIVDENLLVGSALGEFAIVPAKPSADGAKSSPIAKLTFKDHGMTINPERSLWMKPRYNAKEHLLWIVSFSRSSLFLIKCRKGTNGRPAAFAKMLEFPSEVLGDFALDPSDPLAFFFKDPKGFSHASVPTQLMAMLEDSQEQAQQPQAGIEGSAEQIETAQMQVDADNSKYSPEADLQGFAKALDENAASAVQQDAQQAEPAEPLIVNQDPASNKPGSGLVDADVARQESEIRSEQSVASKVVDKSGSTPVAGLESIAQVVKKALATQLEVFSSAQSQELRAIHLDLKSHEADRQQTLITLVTEVIERDVKKLLHEIVTTQVEEKVAPLLVSTLQQQTANAFNSEIPAQINSALQDTVLSQVERSLIPHLGRTFTATLSPIVERNVRTLIADSLVPKFLAGVDNISDALSDSIHREMLEVRKDVLVEQSAQLKTSEAMIQDMTASMKMLIGQVRDLSDQVKELKGNQERAQTQALAQAQIVAQAQAHAQAQAQARAFTAAPSQPLAPQSIGGPAFPPTMAPAQANQPVPRPPAEILAPRPSIPVVSPSLIASTNLPVPIPAPRLDSTLANAEEDFLNALMTLTDTDLIQFVTSRQGRIHEFLPAPGQAPCPLSQQVILTMIHRLSKAISPLPTSSPEYQNLLQWIIRSAYLIDGQAPDIKDFFAPVRSALAADYQALIARYAQQQDRSPPTVQAVRVMNQVLQVLGSK